MSNCKERFRSSFVGHCSDQNKDVDFATQRNAHATKNGCFINGSNRWCDISGRLLRTCFTRYFNNIAEQRPSHLFGQFVSVISDCTHFFVSDHKHKKIDLQNQATFQSKEILSILIFFFSQASRLYKCCGCVSVCVETFIISRG